MISYRHVTTFGGTQSTWLSGITDLTIVESGGQSVLVVGTRIGGGISTYTIPDPEAPLVQLRTRPYLNGFTYDGPPEISLVKLGGRSFAACRADGRCRRAWGRGCSQ